MSVNGVTSFVVSDAFLMFLGALIGLTVMEACFRGAMALARRRARRRHWAKRMAEANAAYEEARAARLRAEESRQRTEEILARSAQVLDRPDLAELYKAPAEDDKTQ